MNQPETSHENSPFPTGPPIQVSGCLVVFLVLILGCLVPLFLIEVAQEALINLHLSPTAAFLVLLGILLGSPINLPISRRATDRQVLVRTFEPIAGYQPFPSMQQLREEMIIAINVGGCLIPSLLALWVLRFLLAKGGAIPAVLVFGCLLNIAICYRMAQPVKGMGIRLMPLIPALVAFLCTRIGLSAPEYSAFTAPTAYVIGISGPLIGADLLNWRKFDQIGSGVISIGGAGTWDGILLSGLAAAFLS